MTLADERLSGAREKVSRGVFHLHELQTALKDFYRKPPYALKIEDDPQTKTRNYTLTRVDSPPALLSIIAGEIAFSVRSALDHVAYQLVQVGSGSRRAMRHVYFPICEDAKKYVSARDKQLRGARAEAIAHIDAIEPYRGGKGELLWKLAVINNTDKHRLLLTCGAAIKAVDIETGLPDNFPPIWKVQLLRQRRPGSTGLVHVTGAERRFPLKSGDVLHVLSLKNRRWQEPRFGIEVAFGEVGLEGESLFDTLNQMGKSVQDLLPTFEKFLE